MTTLATVDRSDMLGAIATLPSQLRDGLVRSEDVRVDIENSWPADSHAGVARPRTLVVCGMGGSGVGADLLVAAFQLRSPVVPVKGYDLPEWVSDEDRVVCVSYSGETSETLSCMRAAMERSVVAAVITTGGKLASIATAQDIPVVTLPGGMQPRAAVGVLFGALAGVAEALNVVDHAGEVVEEAARGAESVIEQHGTTGDALAEGDDAPPALRFARELDGTVVCVYGSGPTAAVAWRWKAQINENGKLPAFANAYPELNHNELVGWERATTGGTRWSLIELVSADTSSPVRARMDITRELIASEVGATLRIEAVNTSRAGSVFELLTWGDYVSVYLALLAGIDPSPVERIRSLKDQLAGR